MALKLHVYYGRCPGACFGDMNGSTNSQLSTQGIDNMASAQAKSACQTVLASRDTHVPLNVVIATKTKDVDSSSVMHRPYSQQTTDSWRDQDAMIMIVIVR